MIRKVYTTHEEFHEQNKVLGTDLPFNEDLSPLAAPLTVGTKTIPNRLACQAMEGCDGNPDGTPGELTLRRYDRFAKGGAGLIWYEATAVLPEAKANPRQLYLHEGNADAFKRQVDAIKETALRENGYEPLIIMQATHSGRYSKPEGRPAPLIAYNNPLFEKEAPLSAECIVTDDYIDHVQEALINSAALAAKVGFDGVDIKACHRYLNSELLSAYTRPGKYGGSLENRTRLLRESIAGAMQVCPSDFIVSSRLNVYDGFPYPYGFGVSPEGGTEFQAEESIWLLRELRKLGVELLNITMGNPYVNPHVNRPFATGGYDIDEHPLEGVARLLKGIAQLKEAVPELKIICSAVSYLGTAAPQVLSGFIRDGGFDVAGFGRTIFANPDFAKDILQGGSLPKDKICLCCSKCSQIMRNGGTPGCVIRDKEVYAPLFKQYVK